MVCSNLPRASWWPNTPPTRVTSIVVPRSGGEPSGSPHCFSLDSPFPTDATRLRSPGSPYSKLRLCAPHAMRQECVGGVRKMIVVVTSASVLTVSGPDVPGIGFSPEQPYSYPVSPCEGAGSALRVQ